MITLLNMTNLMQLEREILKETQKLNAQFYEMFYRRNLQAFVISYSFSPFPVLHSKVGSYPCPQTLDLAKRACQGQTLSLIVNIYKLHP